jgi:hypothetical protein
VVWKWRLRRSPSAPLRSWSRVERLHGVANVRARLMALSPSPSRRLKNSERRHLCPATPPGSKDRQCGAIESPSAYATSRFMLGSKCRAPGAKLEHGSTDSQSDCLPMAAFPAASDKPNGEYSSLRTIPARLVQRAALLAVRKSLVPAAMRCRCRAPQLEVSRASHLILALALTRYAQSARRGLLSSSGLHCQICRRCWQPYRTSASRSGFLVAHIGEERQG